MRAPWLRVLSLLLALAGQLVLGVRDMKFYDTLGVAADADEQAIKKAYRKSALCASSASPAPVWSIVVRPAHYEAGKHT